MWNPSHAHLDAESEPFRPAAGDRRLRVEGRSDSLAGALAALGMSLVREICPQPFSEALGKPLNLVCRGSDHHSLVLSWMETLLYLLEERQVALVDIEVKVSPLMSLNAQCRTRAIGGGRLWMPKALDPSSARATQAEEGSWHTECTLLMDLEEGMA
jgi:hypothetical protein